MNDTNDPLATSTRECASSTPKITPMVALGATKIHEFEQAPELKELGIDLTLSQEYFAYLIANGTSKWESYKLAYKTTTDKKTTLSANAYKIEKANGVKEAVAFYKDQLRLAGSYVESYTREVAFEEIAEAMNWCRVRSDARTMVSLIKLKVDIAGLIKLPEPTKTAPTSNELNNELKEALKNLPEDKRKELSNLLTVIDVPVKKTTGGDGK
jgi:hypothetical protein